MKSAVRCFSVAVREATAAAVEVAQEGQTRHTDRKEVIAATTTRGGKKEAAKRHLSAGLEPRLEQSAFGWVTQ